jgi:hypothetical protein
MGLLAAAGGVSLILIVLGDAFETVVPPRRAARRCRLTRLFYRVTTLGLGNVIPGVDGTPVRAARFTLAMARHALADLTVVLGQRPRASAPDRLPPAELARLHCAAAATGSSLSEGRQADEHLAHLRSLYEPYAHALGGFLLMRLPPRLPPEGARDNWETTA